MEKQLLGEKLRVEDNLGLKPRSIEGGEGGAPTYRSSHPSFIMNYLCVLEWLASPLWASSVFLPASS